MWTSCFFLSLFYFTCVRSHNSCASTCSSFHFALTGKLDVKSFYWDEKSANKWGRLWGKFHRISFELHKVDFWVLIKLGIKKCNNLQCSRMQEDKGLAFLISHDILPTLVWFPICFAFRKITWFFFFKSAWRVFKDHVHCSLRRSALVLKKCPTLFEGQNYMPVSYINVVMTSF